MSRRQKNREPSKSRIAYDMGMTIREGVPTRVISMKGFVKALEYGMLDDIWDEDGDSIGACLDYTLRDDGEPVVHVEFPQGTDPLIVSRMLSEMARLLQRPERNDIANLQHGDELRRQRDGEPAFFNLIEEREQRSPDEIKRDTDEIERLRDEMKKLPNPFERPDPPAKPD